MTSHAHTHSFLPPQAPLVSDQLHTLLIAMIEDSVDQRASLEYIIVACQQHVGEHAEEEVESLITYLLGTAQDVSDYISPVWFSSGVFVSKLL